MAGKFIVFKIFWFGLFHFFFQMASSDSQGTVVPAFVTRNVSDSFGFDLDYDCTVDQRICSRRNAICQSDGSCACRNTTPDYVNPKFTVVDGYLYNGDSDGCMLVTPTIDSIDPGKPVGNKIFCFDDLGI